MQNHTQLYKKIIKSVAALSVSTSILACGQGGSSTQEETTTHSYTPPTVYTPGEIGTNYVVSQNGLSKLYIDNGVVDTNINTTGISSLNTIPYRIITPHNGGELSLQIYNEYLNPTYTNIKIDGNNALESSYIYVSQNDKVSIEQGCNGDNIKLIPQNTEERINFILPMNEGETKQLNIEIYENDVCDTLYDRFDTLEIYSNKPPEIKIQSTEECPSSISTTTNEIYVPYNASCLIFNITNPDNIGENIQYAINNGEWKNPQSQETLDISEIPSGERSTLTISVKENIGNGITDSKTYELIVKKDNAFDAEAYCVDNINSTSTPVSDGGTCEFNDPKGNSNAYGIEIKPISADDATCEISTYKDGTLIGTTTQQCNIPYIQNIDSSDAGSGLHSIYFEISKLYGENKALVKSLQINYQINSAPLINIETLAQNPKEGSNFNGVIVTCEDPEGDPVTITVSSLPYGFSAQQNGNSLVLSANPVPYDLPDGNGLVDHRDLDGDGNPLTATYGLNITCSDGKDSAEKAYKLVIEDTNRAPYIDMNELQLYVRAPPVEYDPNGINVLPGDIVGGIFKCTDPDAEDNTSLDVTYPLGLYHTVTSDFTACHTSGIATCDLGGSTTNHSINAGFTIGVAYEDANSTRNVNLECWDDFGGSDSLNIKYNVGSAQ